MPGLAGLIFVPPLLVFVWMLTRIPPPDADDVAHRSERRPMDRQRTDGLRGAMAWVCSALVAAYLAITIVRSIRGTSPPRSGRAGGEDGPRDVLEFGSLVAFGVLVANGLSILIVDNRRAFFTSIGVAFAGGVLMLTALAGCSSPGSTDSRSWC